MLYGLYASAAGALANSYRQDVIANNLANVDTVAFKGEMALAMARPTKTDTNGQLRYSDAMLEGLGGGTFALPTYTDFTPAALKETGSPFDLALTGPGFFQVRNGSEINYTRDGRFVLDEQNQLATSSAKHPVLDNTGQPIVLDPHLPFKTDQTGMIFQAGSGIASLGIVDFADPRGLTKQGENLYATRNAGPAKPVDATVREKFLEISGVDPMRQLVEMIKTQRMFQANISMLQLQDQTLGQALTRLASIT